MSQDEKLLIIGGYCRTFRTEILKLTLHQFETISGVKVKTISSFENGKSTNVLHILKYLDLCPNNETRIRYLKGLNKILGGL